MIRRVLMTVFAALLLLPAAASSVSMTDVAQELRCVTCGTSLDVSDAPAAQQMKTRINKRIAEGASKQQIIDEFVHDYGRQVLATPPKRGFDLVAGWLIPIGVIVVALMALPFVVRAWNRRRAVGDSGDAAVEELPDAERDRVDRELEALDG